LSIHNQSTPNQQSSWESWPQSHVLGADLLTKRMMKLTYRLSHIALWLPESKQASQPGLTPSADTHTHLCIANYAAMRASMVYQDTLMIS
jgi:hypothetical protein